MATNKSCFPKHRKRKATKMEFCSGLSNIPQGNLLMGGPGKPNSFKGT